MFDLLKLITTISATSNIVAVVVEVAIKIREGFEVNGGLAPNDASSFARRIADSLPVKLKDRYGIPHIVPAVEAIYGAMHHLHLGKKANK